MLLNYLQVFAYAQLFRVVLTSKVLNVTILLDVNSNRKFRSRAGTGFLVALDAVSRKKLLTNYTIRWRIADTGCSVSALDKFIPLWKDFAQDIHAVIGPSCSDSCRSIGLFTAAFLIPEVSYFCTSNKLSKRSVYTTFSRTVGDITIDIPKMVLMAAEKLGWRNFYIIGTRVSPWFEAAYSIKETLDNTTLPHQDAFTSSVNIVGAEPRFMQDVENVLENIRQQNTPALIILCITKDSGYDIVRVARNKRFSRDTYAFLVLDYLHTSLDQPDVGLLEGTVTAGYGYGDLNTFERFQLDAFAAYQKEDQLKTLFSLDTPSQVTVEDAMLHDALLLWALSINRTDTMKRDIPLWDAWSGLDVAANIPDITFNGASGFVTLIPNGERVPNFTLGVINQGRVVMILIHHNSTNKWEFLEEGLKQIGWENLRLIPGTPIFDNSVVEWSLIQFWICLMALTLVSALGIVFSKCRYEVELKSIQHLMLDCSRIRFSSVDASTANKRKSLFSRADPGAAHYSFSISPFMPHPPSPLFSTKNLNKTPKPKTYFGYYEDRKICVKIFYPRRTFHVKDRHLSIEFLQLWKLNHPNINGFIGACSVVPKVLFCMQFASRGSVSDIIARKTIQLTPGFRLALAIDIAQGMKHLHHSPIASHGHLTSTNCVVDDQWTCKITDHGLCRFRSEYLRSAGDDDNEDPDRLLWTSPELLNLVPKKRPICGSQTGDIYSFAIILQELCYETQPFGELSESLGSKTIVSRVKAGEDPPFRPLEAFQVEGMTLDDISGHSPLWIALMQNCWMQDPWFRPSFAEIILRLTVINGGKLINPVETVIKMLEEHTQKLEEIVHKRSELLYEEKHKAEDLLYSVLPIQVAEELKQGNKINPEEFSAVTIYVSDIVEFTPLSAISTAIQVVTMLGILFNMFDKLIDTFGVYKLETIGDAYVVAGGLPERNGDLHATQIASMALHILSCVFEFKIPHLPERPLRIRTGIHTGPVVAGLAGTKMPRYCLFGATVNTAFAMEASAKPMTINVSDSTAQLLLNSKLFELEKLEKDVFEGGRRVIVHRLLSLRNKGLPMPDNDSYTDVSANLELFSES